MPRISLNRHAAQAILETATQQDHFSQHDILAAVWDWLRVQALAGRKVGSEPIEFKPVADLEHPDIFPRDAEALSAAVIERLGYWAKRPCTTHPTRFNIDCVACNHGEPRWVSHPVQKKPESMQ